ncbi:transcription antitermination factor NusB [Adlercreutzia sp. R21]|uniref:Transcription antitermination factor NusB n=1 Tax=Adlercreutzia wanghongyangiae TaxID=3111451 RepID=A0ABU6IHQ0_9ACTN|nr:transcription antitermination factor NusB [Adlercreutzia sp. R21]MEC4175973.1 transcription antitermination factor NusB [Adlercreutzia sp. R7]MEC4184041.1 transcription antitermination factor NusB [Adlercreutzia sp. R21]
MHNDHRSHNQRRSYDRASQGDRNAQGGARQNRGPRTGGARGDRDFRGPRKDDRGPRKGGFSGGPHRDGRPGADRGSRRDFAPRDDRPRDDRPQHPRDDRRYDQRDDRARSPRDDRSPRFGGGPRRDSREASHPREIFVDGKLMAAPDQDAPRGPRSDDRGPRGGARGPKAHRATTARELALAAIHQLRQRDAFAQDVIAKTIDTSRISREDRAFATRLVLGVASTRGTLEDIVSSCMDSPDDAAPAVRDALCLSAYEIIFLQKSPHAAVDQGVELVKSVAPRAGGLANAVLRRVVRAKESFPFGDPRTDIAAYARLHGFPVWLAQRLLAEMGPQGAHSFMVASNEPAPVYIAVNAVKASDDEVVSVLADAHGEPEPVTVAGRTVPGCYRIVSGVPLNDGRVRRMFSQGLLLVSDATSQVVASLVVGQEAPQSFLEIGAGRATKTILDQSCAYRRFGAQIPDYVTVDVHAFKTKLLQERVQQYGIEVAEPLIGDATDLTELVGDRTFDRVFVDSPCTGLGTLRRHADIRWRLRPETIEESAALDARLLASAAPHVAPGGILAYATCTITHEENADAVAAFLDTEAGAAFEVVPCDASSDGRSPFFSVALEPGGPDAHFLALLRRKF